MCIAYYFACVTFVNSRADNLCADQISLESSSEGQRMSSSYGCGRNNVEPGKNKPPRLFAVKLFCCMNEPFFIIGNVTMYML